MDLLKKAIVETHANGGILLVTSNTSYDYLMEHGFVADKENRARVLDRAMNMFKVIEITGDSYRQRTPWYLGTALRGQEEKMEAAGK